jgi:hypothetical protein
MFRNPRQPAISLLAHLVVMGVLLFALSSYILSFNQFLLSDTALRFIQIQNIIANDWQTLAIDYPFRAIDPELQHTPYNIAFSVVDGQILFNISPFFPLASAYFYHLLGTAGFAIIPVVGTLLTAVALYQLAGLAQLPHRTLLLWAAVLATPLLFYSLKLWDHTLGVALATWGVYGLARGQHLGQPKYAWLGGVCLGVGLGQRPELYVFTVAVGLAFVLVYRSPKATLLVMGGGLLGALPIWLAQWRWVGHPLGMAFAPHLLGYGKHTTEVVSPSYDSLVKNVYLLTDVQSGLSTILATVLLVVGGALFVLAMRGEHGRIPLRLTLALGLLAAGYLLYGYHSLTRLLVGILPSFPLFALPLIYPKHKGEWPYQVQLYHFIALTALSYLGLMFLFWPSYGGTQWGSRYLLVISVIIPAYYEEAKIGDVVQRVQTTC